MKKIIAGAVISLALPFAVMAALPTVGCSLDASSNFVQKGQSVTFTYAGNGMSQLQVLRGSTVIATPASMSGTFTTAVSSSDTYSFRFSGVNGSAECSRTVSVPNITVVR
jgi:hypothetical protein